MTRTIFEKRFAGAAQLLKVKVNLGEVNHGIHCDSLRENCYPRDVCNCGLQELFDTLADYEKRVKGRDEGVVDPLGSPRKNWIEFVKALTPEEIEYLKNPEPSENET